MITDSADTDSRPVTRLAPSPTGALHLGNVRTFLINWAIARQNDWRIVMRIEDLDGPRIKPEAAQDALDALVWLGMDWDGPPLTQSEDLSPYINAMRHLASAGVAYSCELTRTQIEAAASAPHVNEHEQRFPPRLRPAAVEPFDFADLACNHRLVVNDRNFEINDRFVGLTSSNPHQEVGDFVVWTRRGSPSYQLAVVVDDHRQGVTDVIRADDLLPSAARQQLLYENLGWEPPRWWHVPLILGPDGRRLAKRHGDTRVQSYRDAGVRPEAIIGLMAYWCGITESRQSMSAREFITAFDLSAVPRSPITFNSADDRWLEATA